MRALLLIILLAVLALLAVREFRETQPDVAAATTQVALGDPADRPIEGFADTHVQDEAAQAPGDTIPQPGARQLVHVPGTASANDDAPDFHALGVANEHLEAYARYNLDLALANDLEAALRLDQVHTRCREVPETLADLDQHVERQIDMFAMFRDKQPEFTPPDALEIRQRNLDQFAGCQFYKEFFNKALRERLSDLAAQGHVTARYLYAMWPPSVKGRTDAFFIHQEWAEKALAFSQANLAEGEVAGLMAFAHAYQKPGMFTTLNQEMGMAFQIAAQECGLDAPFVVTDIEHYLSDENFPPFREDTRPAVLAMVEGLRGLCMQ
jgi:hypothetical protein